MLSKAPLCKWPTSGFINRQNNAVTIEPLCKVPTNGLIRRLNNAVKR